jgi:hypothetical protein
MLNRRILVTGATVLKISKLYDCCTAWHAVICAVPSEQVSITNPRVHHFIHILSICLKGHMC